MPQEGMRSLYFMFVNLKSCQRTTFKILLSIILAMKPEAKKIQIYQWAGAVYPGIYKYV